MQRALVAAQAHDHAVQRPGCSSCNGICHIKDWRPHQIATLFGGVTVRLPRWLCTGCRRIETGMSWPSHCRSTPELDQLQAHLSALMSYRVAAGVLGHLLPVEASTSPETFPPSYAENRRAASRRGPWPSRRPRSRRSASVWIPPSSAAATTANAIWRFASATSRRLAEVGRYLALFCQERHRHHDAD